MYVIGAVAIVLGIVIIVLVLKSVRRDDERRYATQNRLLWEKAFLTGQARALNGDVYIEFVGSRIISKGSIWEDGSPMLYDPYSDHLELDL